MTIRNSRFLAGAIHLGLRAALEEQSPDAGDLGTNDVAATAASGVAAASAAQEPVQGVDSVAQAQIEPVVAASGGEQSTEGKPPADAESTVEVPNVDSVAELQDHVGALEDALYEVDQENLQGVSQAYQDDLEEAVDVVASLEALSDNIDFAISKGYCNPSTNAAFYQSMVEAAKRGNLYSRAALEDGELVDIDPKDAGNEKGARSIGDKVKEMASGAGKAILEGMIKFIAWLINVVGTLISGADGIIKKLEEFEANKLQQLKGGEITNRMLIARIKLVQGGGDAPAQFTAFTNYCTGMLRVLAGPIQQLNLTIAQNLNGGTSKNLQPLNSSAIDRLISMMYPENINPEDLRGQSEIGTDWAQGSTPDLLGGLRCWVASNHHNAARVESLVIRSGISRDVATETPESIAGADPQSARSDIRQMVSILKQWKGIKLATNISRVNDAVIKIVRGNFKFQVEGAMEGMSTSTVLGQYSSVLRAFSGANTVSLIRHMLYTFNVYAAYLNASVAGGAEEQEQQQAAA